MSLSQERSSEEKLVQRSESGIPQDHLAGQRDTCKTDSGSRFCIRCIGSDHCSD